MKKFFGFGKNKNRKKHKKRLSPSELAPPDGVFHASSPMFQYARSEFAQTVASGTSNDDGRGVLYKSPSETPSKLFAESTTAEEEELLHQHSSLVANIASSSTSHSSSFHRSSNNNNNTWMSPIAEKPYDDSDQQSYVSQQRFQPVESVIGSTFETQLSGSLGATVVHVDAEGGESIQQQPSQISSMAQQHQQQQQPQPGSIGHPFSSPTLYQPPQNSSMPNTASSPTTTIHTQQPPQQHHPDNNNNNNNPNLTRRQGISPTPFNSQTTATTATSDNVSSSGNLDQDYLAACSASNLGRQESLYSQASSSQFPSSKSSQRVAKLSGGHNNNHSSSNYNNHYRQFLDPPAALAMPDATYEEEYGDAYIGGPIKYIYPSGYQSMRPRSGPWKLSIVIFVSFTWLSIFIVGHCSDRVDNEYSQYNQNEIDDDTLVIETRWCGSRLLYMMWVISMLVTGLAAAYCSIIGYIKVRDFAVANSRSQPPGMMGKTDFYAQVDDAYQPHHHHSHPPAIQESPSHLSHYHVPIYQSDGNPQFWGGHIYRPTQAAVAITSR